MWVGQCGRDSGNVGGDSGHNVGGDSGTMWVGTQAQCGWGLRHNVSENSRHNVGGGSGTMWAGTMWGLRYNVGGDNVGTQAQRG